MRFVRLVIGALLAGVAIFIWGFVFWAMIPQPTWGFQPVPGEHMEQVDQALLLLETGTYKTVMPGQIEGESTEEIMEREAAGPIAFISVRPDGAPMDPMVFVEGLIHGFLASAIAGLLLLLAAPALPGYSERVKFVLIAGIFCTIWAQPGYSIWFHRSCGVTTWFVIYDVVAWLLAGLILAFFVTGYPRIRREVVCEVPKEEQEPKQGEP